MAEQTLAQAMGIRRGCISVIGSGGKTSLMKVLSEELCGTGILTTTTHILPFSGIPLYSGSGEKELRELLATNRIMQTGTPAGDPEGKLSPSALPIASQKAAADFVLVEADGAAHHFFTAHDDKEPVIPRETDRTILILGAGGFGLPVSRAAHHPELFEKRSGLSPEDPVTPAAVGYVLFSEDLPADTILMNGAVTDAQKEAEEELAGILHESFPMVRVFGAELPLPEDPDRSVSFRIL